MNTQQVENDADVQAGQASYNPFFLSIYDFLVLRFSNRLIWRCPYKILLDNFNKHMSKNHLDVGVGSGFFLVKAANIRQCRRVGLLDLNQNALYKASTRVKEKHNIDAELYHYNALSETPLTVEKFDSVSLNYLLHCMPGDVDHKLDAVMKQLTPSLNTNSTIFGSTILGIGVPHSGPAKKLMSVYNEKKIFSNSNDSLSSLESELKKWCKEVEINVHGCVAVFSGKTL